MSQTNAADDCTRVAERCARVHVLVTECLNELAI